MKSSSLIKICLISILATIIFTGCTSDQEKVADAKENVADANEELQDVKDDINADGEKTANADEWQAFRSEAEQKINENEIRIMEHREKMRKAGKTLDAMHEKRITDLEEKNRELKSKLNNYNNNKSDWESFKAEYNSDMNDLGDAFKNLTIDNKN